MAETSRHPFLEDLSKYRGAPPTAVVIFGASGDLTARKLIPAVYNLAADNLLPPDFHLVGYGRKEITDDAFREMAAEAIKEFSRRELSEDVWGRIAERTTYVAGGYDDPKAFERLAQHLGEIDQKVGVRADFREPRGEWIGQEALGQSPSREGDYRKAVWARFGIGS